jgi:hypothetical protein
MVDGPIQTVQNHVVAQATAGLQAHAVTPGRKKAALVIAGLADLIQLGFFPVFAGGALEIPDDVLDVIVAIALFALLGFKARILMALALELVPGVALFPSWTAVVATLPTAEAPKKKVRTEIVEKRTPPAPLPPDGKLPETDAYQG